MRWNGNYGRFSKAYFDSDFNGKEQLLEKPWRVKNDPALAFTSLLWYYMTPHHPAPSVHNVVTGFFIPNEPDSILETGNNFGTTIAIMAQDKPDTSTDECGTIGQVESQNAITRGIIYSDLLK